MCPHRVAPQVWGRGRFPWQHDGNGSSSTHRYTLTVHQPNAVRLQIPFTWAVLYPAGRPVTYTCEYTVLFVSLVVRWNVTHLTKWSGIHTPCTHGFYRQKQLKVELNCVQWCMIIMKGVYCLNILQSCCKALKCLSLTLCIERSQVEAMPIHLVTSYWWGFLLHQYCT